MKMVMGICSGMTRFCFGVQECCSGECEGGAEPLIPTLRIGDRFI
jgi:hypothetical protein